MRQFLVQHSFRRKARGIIGAIAGSVLAATVASCDGLIYDDLAPCESGVNLRFVYDYNMEFANSFYSQVDDLTLFIYDAEGDCVKKIELTEDQIGDEAFRLNVDLDPGFYRLIAYGGVECDDSSFDFETDPSQIKDSERRLRLRAQSRPDKVDESAQCLHSMFYGAHDVVVPEPSPFGRVNIRMEMLKNTNNFRIVLQQVNGNPLTHEDFEYEIVDDNVLFAYDNSLLPTTGVKYMPWSKGNQVVGSTLEGEEWVTTYAELSTSRLIDRSTPEVESRAPTGIKPGITSVEEPRLRIRNRANGSTLLDIPLINYLELYKSDLYGDMPLQEFLDRQSTWQIVFFLDANSNWISSVIQVNGWTVRINNIDNR